MKVALIEGEIAQMMALRWLVVVVDLMRVVMMKVRMRVMVVAAVAEAQSAR